TFILLGLLILGFALPLTAQSPARATDAGPTTNQVADTTAETAWNFVNSGQQLTIGKTNSVVLADLNGNGDLHILESNDFSNRRWTNDGHGVFFFLPTNYGTGGQESAVADLNGDGHLDFFVARGRVTLADTGENQVWLAAENNSFITFQNSGQQLGNANSRGVALADLNGDGFVDAFVANSRYGGDPPVSNANTVWFNDGAGNFSDSGQRLGISDSEAVALADLNGDGFVDAAVANGGSTTRSNKVWFNDGDGNFSDSGQDLGFDWSWDVVIGDVNGDSHPDLMFGTFGGNAQLWLNNGSGVFSNSGQPFADGQSVALGDLDGDNDLDLVIGKSSVVGSNQVWENDGSGNFTNSGLSLGSEVVYDIALGDVDRDGDLDILFAGNGSDEVLWFNQTPQNFVVVATIYLPLVIR
ncbi:MAG: VCBS repeat-containing protein, partial [Ardenticatenaceae bacterium]|nr:VCBS repeat-containing protein [Ardenticatenaceae bacterium]